MERLSGGEFSARSRLSPKALRLYQELGLLVPATIDPDTGYRSYELAQLEQAHLIALLRRIALPLAEIKAILALEPAAAAPRSQPTGRVSRPSTTPVATSPATSSIYS